MDERAREERRIAFHSFWKWNIGFTVFVQSFLVAVFLEKEITEKQALVSIHSLSLSTPARFAMDLIRSLPYDCRHRALPFAVRVIRSKAELVAAIDDVMDRGVDTAVMERWDVSGVDDFSHVFDVERNWSLLMFGFNADLSGWDVSNATDLSFMFHGCSEFNSDLSRWNVSNATNLSHMFEGCIKCKLTAGKG
jgi:surface protein